MKALPAVYLSDVQQVYTGPEDDLWELVMGEQIHIGGLTSSMDLAEIEFIQDLAHAGKIAQGRFIARRPS